MRDSHWNKKYIKDGEIKIMKIGKTFEFEACHNLPDNDVYGKCSNKHGHRYELMVEVFGNINELGWVCNYAEIKDIVKSEVIKKYDHVDLNEFFEIPTAENIILEIVSILKNAFKNKPYQLSKVRLYETRTSYAEIDL